MQSSKYRSTVVLFFILAGISTHAQQIDFRPDLIIINQKLSEKLPDPYKRPYIYKDEPSVIKQINPINIFYGAALYFYQNVISKHLSTGCLYTPTCSEFGKESVREYGLLKGSLLSVDRLSRCSRLSVPELKKYKRDPETNRCPDPVSKYKKPSSHNVN